MDLINDFMVRTLDDELVGLNKSIDIKIKRGLNYNKESAQHKSVVQLRAKLMMNI